MKTTYQVRYQGKQVTATFDPERNGYIIDGAFVHRDNAQYLQPFVTTAQVWEWYGDEDHVGEDGFGRYKAKGGEDFLVYLTEAEAMYDDTAIAKLNAKLNAMGRFFRYEFKGDFSPYYPPTVLRLEGDEVIED